MSASIMDKFAAMLQGTSSTATPLHWKSAILLVRLLQTKQVDLATTLPTIDGTAVTFKEILDSRVENVTRRNQSVGTDYLATHNLEADSASKMIDELKKLPNKAASSFRPKGSSAAKAADGETFSKAEVLELVQALVANGGQLPVSTTPVAAEGHTMVQPAEPVEIEPVAVRLPEGSLVEVKIDGVWEIRQLSADGKRLNKTVV